jgi:crotonobetainyl-CoA:carnitine CoA-transferase CaiB-like acyl-CoA transferase
MAPHNVYPALGDDQWVAIACRHDDDWQAIAAVVDEDWARDPGYTTLAGRLARQDELDERLGAWCARRDKFEVQRLMLAAGVPGAAVQLPEERIEHDPGTTEFGLWPWVEHPLMGRVRVDGLPYHLSATDWRIESAAPLLGQHNDVVYGEILGCSDAEIAALRSEGVI